MKKIKLMWANADSVLWNIDRVKEILIEDIDNVSQDLKKRIERWSLKYEQLYKDWLDNDRKDGLFDINSAINTGGIKLCNEINKVSKCLKCYYWFDIDRSIDRNFDFVWQRCPQCNSELISTGLNLNKYVCEKCSIVLP